MLKCSSELGVFVIVNHWMEDDVTVLQCIFHQVPCPLQEKCFPFWSDGHKLMILSTVPGLISVNLVQSFFFCDTAVF